MAEAARSGVVCLFVCLFVWPLQVSFVTIFASLCKPGYVSAWFSAEKSSDIDGRVASDDSLSSSEGKYKLFLSRCSSRIYCF